jgi:acetyl-CoA decarbonylase/synthase complex subunit delta
MTVDRKPGDDMSGLVRLFGPGILDLLGSMSRVELEQVEIAIGELEVWLPREVLTAPQPGAPAAGNPRVLPEKPAALLREDFAFDPIVYPGKVREVTLGATRRSGGTRGKVLTIGGSTSFPFSHPAQPPPREPAVSLDVFDTHVPMPKALKAHVKEVLDDPAAWARLNVEKFGADAVTVHLLSTDPLLGGTSAQQAVRTVEEILQAVDVPIIIGGCGDPKKDAEVFCEVAAMAEGERLLLNSVTADMAEAKTLEPVARAAERYGHLLLAFTGLDLNSAKELNRRLYPFLSPDRIVMDLTTVALGYGLEYAFTIHERARIAALMGDDELQHPTISGSTNAWAAREAWMDLGPGFGSRKVRGPLWETLTAATLLLAGVDIFMMMHPFAVSTVRQLAQQLASRETPDPVRGFDWVSVLTG